MTPTPLQSQSSLIWRSPPSFPLVSHPYLPHTHTLTPSPLLSLSHSHTATESLYCNLSLVGPNDRGILRATHNCSRPVTSLCQVSRLPATSCTGQFEFNTSPLGPGTHAFVLVAEDSFGESIMKVFPFFIETGENGAYIRSLTLCFLSSLVQPRESAVQRYHQT